MTAGHRLGCSATTARTLRSQVLQQSRSTCSTLDSFPRLPDSQSPMQLEIAQAQDCRCAASALPLASQHVSQLSTHAIPDRGDDAHIMPADTTYVTPCTRRKEKVVKKKKKEKRKKDPSPDFTSMVSHTHLQEGHLAVAVGGGEPYWWSERTTLSLHRVN